MSKLTVEQKRIKELEAKLKSQGVAVPVELKGTYLHEDGNKYAFKSGLGHQITVAGKVQDKNKVIEDKELMTYLIERKTVLIEVVEVVEVAPDTPE